MMPEEPLEFEGAVCPVPLSRYEKIVLGHGSGGKMSYDLIRQVFMPFLSNPILAAGDDAGIFSLTPSLKLAFSTDAHVVFPLFFPGGDIGRLAVCGTVNDVAMMGAQPLFLSVSFILEEGFPVDQLGKIAASMQAAAAEAGIQIAAGDTKVVQKGKADGVYISTSGLGLVITRQEISGHQARPGDKILVSGSMGDHGIAILAARGELGFSTTLQSDVAPLNHLVQDMIAASDKIHVLRDPTRGGLATTLNEIAQQSQVGMVLEATRIPVNTAVNAACEMLGFDPLYIANEGKLVAIVALEDAERLLLAMQQSTYGKDAAIIGEVTAKPSGRVLLKTPLGTTRVLEMLSGELLPRIC
jgi:hydrogenase expression/formation protein HypE